MVTPHTTRPSDLVNVLEQLPPDVVGRMVLRQLDGDSIRRFKLVAPSTLALVRRSSRVLHLGRSHGRNAFPNRLELEAQARILAKYDSLTEVKLDVGDGGVSPLLVGVAGGTQQGWGRSRSLQRTARPSSCVVASCPAELLIPACMHDASNLFALCRAVQVRLHAARTALSHRARSTALRVHGVENSAKPSLLSELHLLAACMATCLPRLEELSLDLGKRMWYIYDMQFEYPSILAPLAGLPHLATLSVAYPGRANIKVFQAGPGHWLPLHLLHHCCSRPTLPLAGHCERMHTYVPLPQVWQHMNGTSLTLPGYFIT